MSSGQDHLDPFAAYTIMMNLPLPPGKLRVCPLWFPEPTIASRCMQEENAVRSEPTTLLTYLPETAGEVAD